MSAQQKEAVEDRVIELANSNDIEYRAFGRKYADTEAITLTLAANCSYTREAYQIFFEDPPDGPSRLMQITPEYSRWTITYYCTRLTVADGEGISPRKHVDIEDAHGVHRVNIEMLD